MIGLLQRGAHINVSSFVVQAERDDFLHTKGRLHPKLRQ